MLTDLRHAARTLRRTPVFAAAAALILGLGIGGSTGVFSLVHAVLAAPLPFGDASRIVTIWERRETSRDGNLPVSGHEYFAWKERTRTFDRMALFHLESRHLTGGGDPERVLVVRASADYFPLLRIEPALGRRFAEGEDRSGGGRVAILGDGFWRRRFGGDPTVIGQSIALDDQPATIVGVLPPLPRALTADLWLPIDLDEHAVTVGRHNLSVLARLAPGVTLGQASTDVGRVAAALEKEHPGNTGHRAVLVPLREHLVGEFRGALLALSGAVGLLLLIACANVANMLLSQGSSRQREFAVRSALGASRARILRLVLAESVLLAAAGGAIGLLLSQWLMDAAAGLTAVSIPLLDTARLNRPALTMAAFTTLLTGVAAGLAAALQFSRERSRAILHEDTRMSESRTRGRLRSLLVGSEVALALVLLAGAALMINSFLRLSAVQPGFNPEGALVAGIDLPDSRYPEAHDRRRFVDTLLSRLRATPGVESAGGTSNLPLGGTENWTSFAIEGRPEPVPGQEPAAAFRVVTTGYFRAMQIPLRAGRFFEEGDARVAVPIVRWFPQQRYPDGFDRPQPRPVAVVSEEAVRRFWPGEDPVGRQIRVLFSPEITIVGVVGDVRHTGLDLPIAPHIYLSHNQEPWGSLSVVVRTTGAPLAAAAGVREHVRALDPRLPVPLQPLDEVLGESLGRPRFYTALIGLFAAVALILSAAGIAAVVSYSTARRTREIGVRLALGAERRDVTRLVVSQGMRPVLAGVLAGMAGAFLLTRALSGLLFGVRPGDPLTLAAAVLVLGVVALVACWIPAWRASRLDPVSALRVD